MDKDEAVFQESKRGYEHFVEEKKAAREVDKDRKLKIKARMPNCIEVT